MGNKWCISVLGIFGLCQYVIVCQTVLLIIYLTVCVHARACVYVCVCAGYGVCVCVCVSDFCVAC